MLQWEQAGSEEVVHKEHLWQKLPAKEYGPAVVSRARQRTISLYDGWGQSLYPLEFASSAGRPKAAEMSAALSTPGQSSMLNQSSSGLGTPRDVIEW